MSSTWKQAERRVATITGGKRTGPTGRNTPDVEHDVLAPEVKHRATLPAWLHAAIHQAERNAPANRTPCVVLHEAGQRYDDCYVVLKLSDIMRLIGVENGHSHK